uniref:Uncharacterized protein n=1 Tax=Dendroctonus ponderosae TaxID=77166 RepID=A0AAR5PZY7_DENPD
MRPYTIYGSLFMLCLIVSFTTADKKWKYNDENPYQKTKTKEGNSRNRPVNDEELAKNAQKPGQSHQQPKDPGRKNKKSLNADSSEEEKPQEHKKIIARIEHGKVKILRRKETQDVTSEEDPKAKVCKKAKADCWQNIDDDSSSEENDSSSEEVKPKGKKQKKIKYSIKFQHEKQKKKEDNGNMRIMRLHKNGRKEYGMLNYVLCLSRKRENPDFTNICVGKYVFFQNGRILR